MNYNDLHFIEATTGIDFYDFLRFFSYVILL